MYIIGDVGVTEAVKPTADSDVMYIAIGVGVGVAVGVVVGLISGIVGTVTVLLVIMKKRSSKGMV